MPFAIVRQDITKMKVDAIVNAANTALQMGGGVCGAIFQAAGAAQLQAACDKLAPIQTGEAVITAGFALPARFIIHTAGPIYRNGSKEENEKQLRAAYTNSLKRAIENNCESIAFPLISSGIYGYPKDEALQVASSAIRSFLEDHDIAVTLVVFGKSAFKISRERFGAIDSYIDEHYVDSLQTKRRIRPDVELQKAYETDEDENRYDECLLPNELALSVAAPAALDDWLGKLDEPFSRMLLRLIDAKKMTDVEVYKRANLDRKLFSKIRTGKNDRPSKRTVIALAIALELSLDESDRFLKSAGYALSHAVKFDVIVEYFIMNATYDIFKINEVLFVYDQALLGG